jgi:cytochrome c-type biogenesis protein CcmH
VSLAGFLIAAAAPMALASPAQEARAEALEMEIRCVQCQNAPIAQSTADMAADMRELVRERVAAGDSDDQIRAFFRQRYGDFVLFRPPWDDRTWLLWASPLLLAALGLGAIGAFRRSGEEQLRAEEGER